MQTTKNVGRGTRHACLLLLLSLSLSLSAVFLLEGGAVERKGAKGTLARDERLRAEAEEGNHGEASVLDLGLLEVPRLLVVAAGKVERVEDAARVAALLGIALRVAQDLHAEHEDALDVRDLGEAEGELEAEVRGLLELDRARVVPLNARRRLRDDDAQGREHGPPPVDELALAEALDAEDLRVRREGLLADLVLLDDDPADDVAGLVQIELVNVHLKVLDRLGEAERIEAAVADHRAVEVRGGIRVRKPHRPALELAVADAALTDGAGLGPLGRSRLLGRARLLLPAPENHRGRHTRHRGRARHGDGSFASQTVDDVVREQALADL